MAKPAKKEDVNIKKSAQRWQSDVIVDLIKQYGFPTLAHVVSVAGYLEF